MIAMQRSTWCLLTIWTVFLGLASEGAWAEEKKVHSFRKIQLTDVFYGEGANFGDFNHDGKMDLVSGPYWYAGPEFKERHEYYTAKPYDKAGYSDNFFTFTDDINLDGWDDILVVGFPGKEAFWYENPQGGSGLWPRHEAFDIVDNESPTYLDLTGDGQRELVFHTRGQFGWAGPDADDPTKPWKFHRISPPGPYPKFTHGLGVGDVNGDGKMDILEKNGWFEQPAEGAANTDAMWKRHEFKFSGPGGSQMYVYDVDDDGDNDVITSLAAHAYGLAWYEQIEKDGKIDFVQHRIMGQKPEDNDYGLVFSQLHAVEMVDMDGDGVLDIVTGKRHWAHGGHDPDGNLPAVSYWFKTVCGADGSVSFIPYQIDENSGVGTMVAVGDINGDKLPDVIVGNKLGTFVLLHEAKTVSEDEWREAQPKPLKEQASVDPQPKVDGVGVLPKGADGKPLNLDFETGTLEGWVAEGDAFDKQPIDGDTVARRRPDMSSGHQGRYWIGTFEVGADKPKGTLTSATFEITHPFASFLVAGGHWSTVRVELVRADTDRKIYVISGEDTENLGRVIVDLKSHLGKEVFIRIVDHSIRGWGHINFDDFRFHEQEPTFANVRRIEPLDEYINAGLEPEEAAAAMTVPKGFSVTCSAGEPDVHQPIGFTLDDRGRMWVAEAYSYPRRLPEDEAHDRILIFEDENGDGKFDKRTVFMDGLNLVSGIEVGFGGVWVGAAPHFLFIPDRDRNDVPDGPPEVLLDGWGYQDTHETLNAFIWGPDGWLYGCHGVFTHSRVGKPGTPKEDRIPLNAAIWRYHPTKHVFEVFAHGTSNPWGVDFDDMGQSILTCCVIPHLFHVIQGARYHRQAGQHFNPYTYDDIKTVAKHRHWVGATPHLGNNRSDRAGGGHAHSGAMIYLGDVWPETYRNKIFMNNIHGNRINVDEVERSGSGFVGDRAPDFLLANDSWSQIMNLRYGPDGQVYMVDWYDKNACHHPKESVHDRTNGRIFKVTYGEPKLVEVDIQELSSPELVELQLHKNDWYVRHARRVLQERGPDPQVHAALEKIAFENEDITRQLRGLWALHVVGGLTGELVERGLSDEDEMMRSWTIQLALEDRLVSDELLARLVDMAKNDPSPVVRRYLASAADRISVEQRVDIVQALVSHAEDAGDHNLPLMYWYALEPVAGYDMALALEIASEAKLPPILAFTVRRIASSGEPQAIDLLVEGLANMADAQAQRTLLAGLSEALKGRRKVDMPKSWPATFRTLVQSENDDIRSEVTSLAVKFGDPMALAVMREMIADPKAELSMRSTALTTLVSAKDPELPTLLHALLEDEALRGGAIRALAGYAHPETPERIIAIYPQLKPAEKRDALNTLAARRKSAFALLEAVGEDRIPSRDLTADLIRQLRNLKDKSIEEQIASVWGTVQESSQDKQELIAEYRQLLSKDADVEPDVSLGRAVFSKTCAQCHKLFESGNTVGPEITGSNRANLDYFLTNVLDPSALIGKDYVAQVIITNDGRVVTGIVRQATDDALEVVTANETIVIPRDEIDEMEPSTKSMMPDDILKPLSETELRALVAYLASPQQVPMLATSDNAATIFNGTDLTGWRGDTTLWSVEDGDLVGRTSGLDHNEFLISDLSVGDFRFQFEVKLTNNKGNSGVQFRSVARPDGSVEGYQADIGVGWWGKLYEEHGRGLLWKKSGDNLIKPGEWNTYAIVAVGNRIRTYLNGQLAVDLDDAAGAKRGIIALQLHSGGPTEIRFRNFQLALGPNLELAKGSSAD